MRFVLLFLFILNFKHKKTTHENEWFFCLYIVLIDYSPNNITEPLKT